MSRYLTSAAMALFAFAAPRIASAQASVAGSWLTQFANRISVVNGDPVEEDVHHARITLTVRGDSVLGRWQVLAEGDAAPARPRGLRGVIANGRVHLEADTVEGITRTNDDDDGERVRMVPVYDFTVHGDSLSGTQQMIRVGAAGPDTERPFTATRQKN